MCIDNPCLDEAARVTPGLREAWISREVAMKMQEVDSDDDA